MELPKNFDAAQKPAVDPTLPGGNAILPGAATGTPPAGVCPDDESSEHDKAKDNAANPAGNNDGKGNAANQAPIVIAAAPADALTQK